MHLPSTTFLFTINSWRLRKCHYTWVVCCWWYVVSSQYLRESILIPTCYTLCTTFPVLHLTYYLHNNNTCPLIFLLITYYVRPAIYFYLLSADCLLPMTCCPGPHEFACQISVPDLRARFPCQISVPDFRARNTTFKRPENKEHNFLGVSDLCQICVPDQM